MNIIFPDGAKREVQKGMSLEEIAGAISPKLKKKAVGGWVNHEFVDLKSSIEQESKIEIITIDSEHGQKLLKRTAAQVLALAVKRLYGDVKLGQCGVTEKGFYFDVELPQHLSIDDLPKIEAEMHNIISKNQQINVFNLPYKLAKQLLKEVGEEYSLELLHDVDPEDSVKFYKQGGFLSLYQGPLLKSVAWIKAIKLQNMSGAYWKNDSENQVLQRISGVAFSDQREMDTHIML